MIWNVNNTHIINGLRRFTAIMTLGGWEGSNASDPPSPHGLMRLKPMIYANPEPLVNPEEPHMNGLPMQLLALPAESIERPTATAER